MQPDRKKRKGNPVIGAIALAVILVSCGLGAVIIFDSGDDGGDPVSTDRSSDAEVMCQEFVGRQLKAPATAEYPTPRTSKDGATYTVVGVVDSDNSYGAKIRSHYTCVTTDLGDKKWHPVEVTVS